MSEITSNDTVRQMAADVLNAAWTKGEEMQLAFGTKVSIAQGSYLNNTPEVTAGTVSVPTIAEPTVDIPSTANATDVVSLFDSETTALIATLSEKFSTFKTAYFPDDTSALNTVNGRLATLASTTLQSITAGTVSAPAISEPSVLVPTSIDTASILDVFNSTYADLVALLESKFQTYRSTYFASEGVVYDSAEDWLLASLANTHGAIPLAVQEQIFGDDQARILADKVRAQEAVVAQFAARRFPLPPAAAASAVLQIEQTAQDKLAESSRKIAIGSVDLMQKVLEKALALRASSMQAANEYVKSLASGPDMASRVVGIGYDAQSKLISSVATLLNARTEVGKLSLTASTTNAQIAFEAAKANQSTALESVKIAVSGAIDARSKAMSAALEYVKAMALGPEIASKLVGIGYDAQSKLISSAAAFYNARTQAKEAISKVEQYNNSLELEAATKNQAAHLTTIEAKLKALLSEAQYLAQASTALFNNLHAQVSVNTSSNNAVGYSYTNDTASMPAGVPYVT